MNDPGISSLDNQLIKQIRQWHDARLCREAGVCLVEGQRAITACLLAGWEAQHIFINAGLSYAPSWPADKIRRVSERVAAKISQAHTPSGYLANFRAPTPPPLEAIAGGLVLVGISDPGNLGTLIRCAAAFALKQVVLVGGADPFAHKVIQSTAGTVANIHLYRFEHEDELPMLRNSLPGSSSALAAPCCALVVRDGQHPATFARKPRWLFVGSEANGLSTKVLAGCQEQLTLPMPGQTESLNAAMAGAIACYALFAPPANR
jgi:RNA methyltransferase, TrmH family